jgi:hypothetical protein
MINAVIYNRLSTSTEVTNLVSTRIFPQAAPLNTDYPLIVYTLTSKVPTNTKDMPSVLDVSRFQIDVYAKAHEEAGNINDKIRLALEGTTGTIAGHIIDSIYFERESEGYDNDQEFYRISSDYFIREHK